MSQLKVWHCSRCHHEWEGFCPLCQNCKEVGWEKESLEFLNDIEFISLEQLKKEEQNKQDKRDDYNKWEFK